MPTIPEARTLLLACCALLLAACAGLAPRAPSGTATSVSSPQEQPAAMATIHFHGDTDAELAWKNKSPNLQWGLLFARGDLVVVEEKAVAGGPPALVNSPRYFETEFLNRMATVKGIANGQARTVQLEAGVYDWLVLIDIQGDGVVDGILSTAAAQGPLSSFEFLAGREYFIDVDRKGDLSFRIVPAPGEQESVDAVYLALMDSVSERIAQVDDVVLKEYVELVVEEIVALRQVRGNLCYDLIQSEDRGGVARAYEALPPRLKVRESALIDRVLRSPIVERPIPDDDEFLEALEPVSQRLRALYGDDAEILDDQDRFAQEKDLGCRVYRDLLGLTLLMPLEEAAPIWRYMFSGEDEDEGEGDVERPPVTNI